MNGTITHTGDFGNPNGSGNARMVMKGLPDDSTFLDGINRISTFYNDIKTAGIIATNPGNKAVGFRFPTSNTPNQAANVDEKLLVIWTVTGDEATHEFTFSGVNPASTWAELTPDGLRLTPTGKTAFASAIETLYGFAADSVSVHEGIFYRAE